MKLMGRFATALLVFTLFSTVCSALNSRPGTASVSQKQTLLDPTAAGANSAAASVFAPISQSGEDVVCGSFLPPRLVTVSGTGAGDLTFNVDVVVGLAGAVESVLILDETKASVHSKVADRISRWVYKPALCNGIPVASEGRIEIRGE